MYDRKKYGDRIRQLRIQNEYTQEELAEKLGISTSLLDDLEAGKKECPVEVVVQYSDIFGVTIDMLVLGKEHETSLSEADRSHLIDEITTVLAREIQREAVKQFFGSRKSWWELAAPTSLLTLVHAVLDEVP